ncbi:MAG TPA: thiamine pyrophosphate-dependent dehydrogenase E1 component subunit alpha [Gaiellaceae bacterium]|nr:thiamine pyrophosphate-dependent dehydrogenase E1 component subunit alpha [Gaiellaceae bacterium]
MIRPEDTYLAIATIRRFEERCLELKAQGLIQGSMHLCCGQEAIPVGACAALEPRDALTATYRGHGWAIARGIPIVDLFAELMGRDSPLCGGRGGSAYFSSAEHGFLGENSIVGAGAPIAAGAALAASFSGDGSVSLVSIGDGAMNQGAVHEALNFAAALRLPLIVVVENNVYSELTPIAAMIATETLVERAPAYGMPGRRVDGNEAEEVEAAVREAVDRARAGAGPSLIEAMTERLVGHYDLDPQHYRPRGEVEAAREREPLARLRRRLGDRVCAEIDRAVGRRIDLAVREAERVPFPDPGSVHEHLYA